MGPINTPGDAASDLDAAVVQRELRLPERMITWLGGVHRPVESPAPTLPSDSEADKLLDRLGVASGDRTATLAARPHPTADPALWWVLDHAYHDVLATMGVPPDWGGWPGLPAQTGTMGRHLYVWLCLAVLPHVRHYHAEIGIPDDISWASLGELGREMTGTRLVTGLTGLESSWMLPRTFRGASYHLGRLVFERGQPEPHDTRHDVLSAGESSLGTHIPAGAGRLDPDACEDSFAAARSFFPRYFQDNPVAFCCHSWLMDSQLATYLPANTNIIRFQRRFTFFNDSEPGDAAIIEHVFHRRFHGSDVPTDLLDDLPQDTTLSRAIVTHLRHGEHWYNCTGWCPLISGER